MNSLYAERFQEWRRLCRAAVVEQDPEKLSQIVRKINAKVSMRQRMLRGRRRRGPSVVSIDSRQAA
jgi:hypothetical protein